MPTTANPPKPSVAPSGMSRTASSKLEKTLLLALIPPPVFCCLLPGIIMRQPPPAGNPLASWIWLAPEPVLGAAANEELNWCSTVAAI